MAVRRTLNYFIIIHACNDTRTKAWKGIKVSAVPHNLWAMINAMWILILIAIFKGVNLIGGLVVASGCHVMGRSGRAVGLLAFFFRFDWSTFAIDSEMMGNETSTEQSVPIVFHHSDETIDCQDWHPHNTIFYEAFALRRFFSPCENQLVYGLNEFMKRKNHKWSDVNRLLIP